MSRRIFTRLSIATCTTLLLAACAQTPERPAGHWKQEARNALLAGHLQTAASDYLNAARTEPAPGRQRLMFKAAELLLKAKQPKRAQTVLEAINPAGLNSEDLAQKAILSAQAALLEHNPKAAIAALPVDTKGLTSPLMAQLLDIRASAELLNGNTFGAISDRIALISLLSQPAAQSKNRNILWGILRQSTPAQIEAWQQTAGTRQIQAWLALALIAQNTPISLTAFNNAIAGWQQQYPNMGKTTRPIIQALRTEWQAMQTYPGHIAVLLPFTGRFASVSQAILDGILSAYYRHQMQPGQGQNVTLRFYNTGRTPDQITSIYDRAIHDGADYVIGPLAPEAVTQLALSGQLSVPTLALNYAAKGTAIPAQLYQFGLSPGNEARQIANRASLDGHQRAIILVPNDDWGQKIATAFATRFTKLGGQILAVGKYDPQASDFSPAIVNTLNLDYSDLRRREVSATIGAHVKFLARRRQDVDMIFLAGDPRQVRLLVPQIRFHHGIGLPLYSISEAYSGTHAPLADSDLDSLTFVDAPLLLDSQGPSADARNAMHMDFPNASRRYPRLIALGTDAYDVLPALSRLASQDWARFNGLSGILRMGPDHSLIRQLEGATFQNGIPVLLGQPLISLPDIQPADQTVSSGSNPPD